MGDSGFVSRGFTGRRHPVAGLAGRLPPGQYAEAGFPVLAAGPTPRVETAGWSLKVDGMVVHELEWSWEEFQRWPASTATRRGSCHNRGDPWKEQRSWTD